MITCDLCGGAKDCLPKEIAGREYDICSACWNALAEKLQGKGRRIRETVFLPSPRTLKEREEEEPPLTGGPPKIWRAHEAQKRDETLSSASQDCNEPKYGHRIVLD